MSSIQPTKRKYVEEAFIPQKRLCLRPNFKEIPVLQIVCNYLSYRELLTLEATERRCASYTQKRWKELRIEERFDFDWPNTTTEKGHYIQGKVLFTYIVDLNPLVSGKLSLQKLYDKLEGIMLAYKNSLGAYLWPDLSGQGAIQSKHQNSFKYLSTYAVNGTAGALMCHGLECLKDKKVHRNVSHLFETAIRDGATCASFFAIRYLPKESPLLKAWVLMSSAKGDYRGLECLINQHPRLSLECYVKGIRYPPVLAGYADFLAERENFKDAAPLWEQAIASYHNQAPFHVYWEAGSTYYYMRKHAKAERLFQRCIHMDQNNYIRSDAEKCLKIAINQYFSRKYDEANVYFKSSFHLLRQKKEKIPLCLLYGWSRTSFRLKNYTQAQLLHKALKKEQQLNNIAIPKCIATEMDQTEALRHPSLR